MWTDVFAAQWVEWGFDSYRWHCCHRRVVPGLVTVWSNF